MPKNLILVLAVLVVIGASSLFTILTGAKDSGYKAGVSVENDKAVGQALVLYNQKKAQKVDFMVNDIGKIFKMQNFNVQPTYGMYDLIIPNLKPFQAINWLATYAIDNGNKELGSPYIFFENKSGFQFVSILRLFKQNLYETYTYQPINTDPFDFDKNLKTIINYEQISKFDTIKNIKQGKFINKLYTVDTVTRSYKETIFNYGEYFPKSEDLNGNPIITNATNRFNDSYLDTNEASIKFSFTNSGLNNNKYVKDKNIKLTDNNVETRLPYRSAQLSLFNSNKYKLTITGDPDIEVGVKIEFIVPNLSFEEGKKSSDSFHSGEYIVSALRHMIIQNTYYTILEISSDTISKPLSTYSNDNQDWKIIRGSTTKNDDQWTIIKGDVVKST